MVFDAHLLLICRDVFQSEDFGVNDEFLMFGDSLTLTQIVSRIGRELGFRVSVVDILEAQTVAGLSRAISERQDEAVVTVRV